MLDVLPIPAFADNYIWLLRDATGAAVVVDPGDAAPVELALAQAGLSLRAILLTHHHADHIGGAAQLRSRHGCAVHAPVDERIPGSPSRMREGDTLELGTPALRLEVLEVPGHTLTHIAFVGDGMLFCGDTLFSAGCGRLFEGSPAQMQAALDRFARLPDATRVYCGHEYTLANLAFAQAVEPDNHARDMRLQEARALRAQGRATLPSTIAEERATNPFLRCEVPAVQAAASRAAGRTLQGRLEVFAALRAWKDDFRAPPD